MIRRTREAARRSAPGDDFFLPELCLPEALLAMILLAELLVLVLVLAEPMHPAFNWERLAFTSLFVQWIVLLSAAMLCRLRPLLIRLRAALAGLLACALVVALTLGCTLAADYFQLSAIDAAGEGLSRYLRHALIAAIMSALLLRYFYLQGQWRRQEKAELQARIESLQARIRPHFLFNSLNSVLSLMRGQPRQAETALENLAELYRALMADNRGLSPLARELELARAYVELEALRLGERLGVDWRVNGAPADALLPTLVLQPLLENAVIHGIEPSPAGGRIGVDIFVRGDSLDIVVRNPARAPDDGARRGNGMALGNIRERLALHFDAEARLSARRVGEEFVVQMVMPLRRGEAGT